MNNKDLNNQNLNELIKATNSRPCQNIEIPKKETIPQEAILSILQGLADSLGLTMETTLEAVFYLFLKGAANKGTPNSLSVQVNSGDNVKVSITKNDIVYFYRSKCGNTYLRRFAEALADDISKFAEINDLEGDL